ncbi:MAG: HEAT repeat domain-containing protein [Planctomycetota bacterium]
MLPRAELEPVYDEIVWLYVYRDFSGSPEDRAAERLCLRLGLTSYPQHLLIHPESLERLGSTGRKLSSFLAAVKRVRVAPAKSLAAVERIEEAEKRAATLERSRSVKKAAKALLDPDVVVRFVALGIVSERAPKEVAERAKELLAVPHDPFRFEVCRALAKARDPRAARPLEGVVEKPVASLNPNVLRIRAVEALGACGDEASVGVIRPFAASGDYRNGLTRISVDALAAIAARIAKARRPVKEALAAAYPEPATEPREKRMAEALAKHVHAALAKVTGRKVPFPGRYDAAARKKLMKAW